MFDYNTMLHISSNTMLGLL